MGTQSGNVQLRRSNDAVTGRRTRTEDIGGRAATQTTSEETDDEEGFTRVSNRRRPHGRRGAVTGCRTGTSLRSVAQIRKVQIFVTRLEADLQPSSLKAYVTEIINDECTVEKLATRYPDYSSFLVTCNYNHMDSLLNPEEWQEGVLVKRFYGRAPGRSNSNNGSLTAPAANVHDG